MKSSMFRTTLALVICSITPFSSAADPETDNRAYAREVGKALGFESWPRSDVLRVGVLPDKSLLNDPELVTSETRSFHPAGFDGAVWGRCDWRASRRVRTEDPLPTKLPPEVEERLLKRVSPPEGAEDPNYPSMYKRLHDRLLKRYQKKAGYRREGDLKVIICLAPHSRGAQERLLYDMTADISFAAKATIALYRAATKEPALGDVNYITGPGSIIFVRDNVAVIISASGKFTDEALPLARKLDSAIRAQPPLSREQLLARRPSVFIAEKLDEGTLGDSRSRTISYELTLPRNQEIARLTAPAAFQWASGGKITVPNRKGPHKITLVAITKELLADSFVREIPE